MWILAGILLAVWGWFMFSKGWGKKTPDDQQFLPIYPQDYYPHYYYDPDKATKGEIQLP